MISKKDNLASKITFTVLFILVIAVAFKIAAPFLIAIVVGALLALALRPIQKKLIDKKIGHKLSVYLVFILLVIVVVVPVGLFLRSLVWQALAVKDYSFLNEISYGSISTFIGKLPFVGHFIADPMELEAQIKTWVFELGSWVSTFALTTVSRIPVLLFQVFLTLLSCLFFLLDGQRLVAFLSERIPLRDDIKNALVTSFKKSSRSAIWATMSASIAQAIIIFLGFITLSIPSAFLAAGATFLFAFIPVIGSVPVWASAAIYLYLQGATVKFIIMIAFGLVAGITDNIVRILILKGRKESIGMHPLISFISVLGGIQVFGLFGVVIGPVALAFLIAMLEVWPSISKKQ